MFVIFFKYGRTTFAWSANIYFATVEQCFALTSKISKKFNIAVLSVKPNYSVTQGPKLTSKLKQQNFLLNLTKIHLN